MTDKKKLSTQEKLDYILNLQRQGLTRKEIANKMEYTRLDTLDRFMKKHGYNRFKDGYKASNGDLNINALHSDESRLEGQINMNDDSRTIVPKGEYADCPTTGIQDKEIQQKLLNMVNNYDSFMDVINWFNGGRHLEDNTNIIEVNTGLQIDFEKSKVIKTTIRVDKDIWDKFGEVCKLKYGHLNKHDLISKSFLDFIDKYNK